VVHFPLRLRIDGDALVSNWRWLASRTPGAACGAAVKADGYGLGAAQTVERLAAAGCHDFFVATWAEAEALAPWPDGLSLSVLHGAGPDDLVSALGSPARPVLNTPAQIACWREIAPGRACDVMVDTGMNRLGLSTSDLHLLEGLQIETLMSHLACADEPGHPLNAIQVEGFRSVAGQVPARRYSLANSGGICLGRDYGFDLTRPGVALYGGVPVPGEAEQEEAIRQVAHVEARLLQLRRLNAGESVGYGATFVAPAPMRIGILNIGYADGYLRSLGNGGWAFAGGRRFPLVGRVSMDLVAVDLGAPDADAPGEGEWIGIHYRLHELAAFSGLSQYELLTTLGDRHERSWT
jgi:alanine racemase